METLAYKISGTWTEVGLTALGVALQVHISFGTHGESKVTLPLATLPPEIDPAIPFEAQCILYTGRTLVGGTWAGGSVLFQGRRTDCSAQASGTSASTELTIEDAWYDLRFLTLQAAWQNITGYSGSTPTYGTPYTWPDCVLFQASAGGPLQPDGSFGTYSPAAVYGHITTGQAIKEMLAYAIYFGGVNLQIGTIDPDAYTVFYPVRTMRVADAIKIALRPHPDCICEIDHTTTPPTFHIRKRANLTPITLPYKSSSGAKTHLTSRVKPRPDLIPTRVALYLKSTANISGNDVVSVGTDIYPSVSVGLRSVDASIDLCGPKLAKTIATLTTAAFDPTDLTWWAKKVPALKSVSAGGQIPNSGSTGALALLDSTINGGTGPHPKGIQVVDDAGNPINISAGHYAYELLTGTPASWMGVNVVQANVVGFFSYNKNTTSGAATVADKVGEHMQTCRVKLIDTAGATFIQTTTLATGEQYPGGLAQSIYTALSTLQYDFTHTILESPFATVIKPGKHCLNLSGGATAWTTMNAMVQSVDMKLTLSPGGGITTAETTVHCGPVAHLEAGELVQLFNLFTNRDLSKINPNERSGGADMSGGQVLFGNDNPKENSVPAVPVEAVKNFTGTDTVSGNINQLTHDATQGQIQIVQKKASDGSTLTTGYIMPVYWGLGPPSATTLETGARYRQFASYWDMSPTVPDLYLCTADGDKTTSVWANISGC